MLTSRLNNYPTPFYYFLPSKDTPSPCDLKDRMTLLFYSLSLSLPDCSFAAKRLSDVNKIIYVPDDHFVEDVRHVRTNRFAVRLNGSLGTLGVASCFAICLRGRTEANIPVLALIHTDHTTPFTHFVNHVITHMMLEGALGESIEVIVVGGAPPDMGYTGTLREEVEVFYLALIGAFNIAAIHFNMVRNEIDDDLCVVLTPEDVFVNRNDLYATPPSEPEDTSESEDTSSEDEIPALVTFPLKRNSDEVPSEEKNQRRKIS